MFAPTAAFASYTVATAMAVVGLATVDGSAEDRVVIRDLRHGQVTRAGQILDFNGVQLKLRTRQGIESRIPSGNVIRIETSYVPEQEAGDQLFQKRDYESALRSYRVAFRAEKRTWVRRQILAQVVWCHRNRNQIQAAISSYLLLIRNEPETRFFHAMPLAWRPQQPNASLSAQAEAWLDDKRGPPTQRLLAASWLLSGSQRSEAIETLRQLTRDRDSRIQQLAMTQLWRAERITASRQQVLSAWTGALDTLPSDLRGGPYYVLGRSLARHGEDDRAVLAFLHVPLEYSHLHDLAGECLWEAGQLLEKAGERDAALRLYEELRSDYPDSDAAAQAASQIDRLRSS